jgi:putative ABC transport system permease protein
MSRRLTLVGSRGVLRESLTRVSTRRFNLQLLVICAALALLLGAVGVSGVMNYDVTQRTHEICICVALGAQTRGVVKLVVGPGLPPTLIGIVVVALLACYLPARRTIKVDPIIALRRE